VPDGIANILSLALIARDHRVQYDSSESTDGFRVTSSGGKKMIFKQHRSGLFVYDTKASTRDDTELISHLETTLLTTVKNNVEGFTKREVKEAKLSRDVYAMV